MSINSSKFEIYLKIEKTKDKFFDNFPIKTIEKHS